MATKLELLAAALTARNAARARHQSDVAALNLGREQAAAAKGVIDKLAADDTSAVTRHAQRLEKHVRAGATGPLPALVPTDQDLAVKVTAQRTHAAAEQMLVSLEAAEVASGRALNAAEAEAQSAAEAVIGEEAAEIASQLEATRARAARLEARLNALRETGIQLPPAVHIAVGDDVNTPINLIPVPQDLSTPIDQLGKPRMPADGPAYWRNRLAQLLSDTNSDPTPASAAA